MGLTGIELFANPDALRAVREEFTRERAGKTYIPLNAKTVFENK